MNVLPIWCMCWNYNHWITHGINPLEQVHIGYGRSFSHRNLNIVHGFSLPNGHTYRCLSGVVFVSRFSCHSNCRALEFVGNHAWAPNRVLAIKLSGYLFRWDPATRLIHALANQILISWAVRQLFGHRFSPAVHEINFGFHRSWCWFSWTLQVTFGSWPFEWRKAPVSSSSERVQICLLTPLFLGFSKARTHAIIASVATLPWNIGRANLWKDVILC